jgi:hypothetical protein
MIDELLVRLPGEVNQVVLVIRRSVSDTVCQIFSPDPVFFYLINGSHPFFQSFDPEKLEANPGIVILPVKSDRFPSHKAGQGLPEIP